MILNNIGKQTDSNQNHFSVLFRFIIDIELKHIHYGNIFNNKLYLIDSWYTAVFTYFFTVFNNKFV